MKDTSVYFPDERETSFSATVYKTRALAYGSYHAKRSLKALVVVMSKEYSMYILTQLRNLLSLGQFYHKPKEITTIPSHGFVMALLQWCKVYKERVGLP